MEQEANDLSSKKNEMLKKLSDQERLIKEEEERTAQIQKILDDMNNK